MHLSAERPVVIFKHSNSCGLSLKKLNEVKSAEEKGRLTDVNFLVVQEARDVSKAVSEDLNLHHETPQIIVIKDGLLVYEDSHEEIDLGEASRQV
jgi:bacillithiol system protein YtxJ